jgi:transposase
MASESRARRKRHSAELNAQILAECAMPGASVARVAMAHGINANVVHRWRQLARMSDTASTEIADIRTAERLTADGTIAVTAVRHAWRRGDLGVNGRSRT